MKFPFCDMMGHPLMRSRQRTRQQTRPRISKRRLLVQNLEDRHLLAVGGFTINLNGSGNVDLFDPNGGGLIQQGYFNGIGGNGGDVGTSIGTSNTPGANNRDPLAVDDTATVGEDGPPLVIPFDDLLVNDTDPDPDNVLSILAFGNVGTVGNLTLDAQARTISYDPNNQFESLNVGQTATDVFEYLLSDGNGGQAAGQVTVTITGVNDAPTVTGAATSTADEGNPLTNSGTYGDVDAGATVTLTADVGTVVDNNDGTWAWSVTTTDDVVGQTVTVTATDEHSAATEFQFSITVNNVAPLVAATSASITVDEGQTANNTGTYSDVVADTVALTASVGNIVDNNDGTWSWSLSTTDGPDDTQTVTITATDDDGGITTTTFDLIVNNAVPIVAADTASVTVDEGQTANNTGTYFDVSTDTVALTASVGNIVDNNDGTWSWSLISTDGPDDTQTVTITATDSDGGLSTTTFDLIVNNAVPVVAADSASVTVDEGQTANNTGTYSDIATDTVALTASVGNIVDNNDGTWSWSLNTTDGPDESQTVTITATDSDGGIATTTFSLTVGNIAPIAQAKTINVLGNVPVTLPLSHLLVGATDVGDDVISFDSIDDASTSGTVVVDVPNQTFTYTPVTGASGTDSFLFTVIDSDGLTHQETATIQIGPSLWVIDNSAAPGGTGTMLSPFDSFAAVNDDGNDPDAPGDIIFVVGTGVNYDTSQGVGDSLGFEFEEDQFLVGSGIPGMTLEAFLTGQGIAIPTGTASLPATDGTSPLIFSSTGDVTTAASGNTVAGVTLDPQNSAGIAGDGVDDLVVQFTIIITSGGGNDNEGIRLSNVTGTIRLSGVQIQSQNGQSVNGTAIQIDGGTASFELDDVDIDQDGGSLIEILNTVASTFVFDENSQLTLRGSNEAAVTITGNTGGTVQLNNAGLSADTTALVTFNITGNTGLQASTPVNDAPEFTLPSTSLQTLEDGGPQSLVIATEITPGLDATEAAQTVTFINVSADDPSLFAVQPAIASDGTLTFTLAGDAVGTATVSVQLQDDGGTADGGIDTSETQTFTIEIIPVNDAPQFTIAGDPLTVAEDSESQTVNALATVTSVGPLNESTQTAVFEITGNSNPALFAVLPAIDAAGNLTYTPAENANGIAEVTMVARDNGGTLNGGVDTSVPQTFTITISPAINDAPTFDLVSDIAGDLYDGIQTATLVTNLSAGPSDESGQTVTLSVSVDTGGAFFSQAPTIASNGEITFEPNGVGQATLTVTATDDGGTANGGISSTSQSFTITIGERNREPVLAAIDDLTGDESSLITFNATATDQNLADTLTFSLDGNEPSGAAISPEGVFTWTPDEQQTGVHTFDVIVSDGAASDSQTITITVNEILPASTSQAEMFAGLAQERVSEGDPSWLAVFELQLQQAEFGVASAVYVLLPGASSYLSADTYIYHVDHDNDQGTPNVDLAEAYIEVEQTQLSDQEFRTLVHGDWTVLIDYDGNFDPLSPADDFNDAKFTIDYDFDTAAANFVAEEVTVVNDSFDNGADNDGVPTGWSILFAGEFSTSDGAVELNDIIGDDESPVLLSDASFDPAGKQIELASSIESISERDSAMIGLYNETAQTGVVAEVVRLNATTASLSVNLFDILSDTEETVVLTNSLAYDGTTLDLQFTFDEAAFRVTANGLDSGPHSFEANFVELDPTILGTSVRPLLASVSDEHTEPNELSGPAGSIIFGSLNVTTRSGQPQVTITSPVVLTDTNPVEMTWDVSDGPFDELDAKVVLDDDTEVFYAELDSSDRSVTTSTLPISTPLFAEVVAVDLGVGFVGQPQTANGFAELPWAPLDGSAIPDQWSPVEDATGSIHRIPFQIELPPFASFDMAIEYIEPPGVDPFYQAILDLNLNDDRVSYLTTIEMTTPDNETNFQFGNYLSADFEPAENQSAEDFIASLGGTYTFDVDFENDGNVDESFAVTVDVSGITTSTFLDTAVINSPAQSATLASGSRSVAIQWDAVAGADGYFAGVNDYTAVETTSESRNVEIGNLPTEQSMLAFVGAYVALDVATVNAGNLTIETRVVATTFTGNDFEIEPTFTAVSSGSSVGTHGGGASTVGGVSFEFVSLSEDAQFNADYLTPDEPYGLEALAGVPEEDQTGLNGNGFDFTGETFQAWDLSLVDTAGTADVTTFTHVDLTFRYDSSLLDQWHSELSSDQIEEDLYLFQYDSFSGTWDAVPLTGRDTNNDTLTARIDEMSLLILGHDLFGPGITSFDPLTAAATATSDTCHAVLSNEQLAPIVAEAIERLAATGLNGEQIEQLRSTPVEIADLEDDLLGLASPDSIQIDINAANHGWYVDPTPSVDDDNQSDENFADSMDLLTVIMHEMNHVLGHVEHSEIADDLMNAVLPTGTRRLPDGPTSQPMSSELVDEALADLIRVQQ
ncbi:Ig-like domain-containing protein [Neorhodopirellula pilleata]|uniref:Cadherin-like domain-containing protein n=1 Tax=Neorhodopirellula pilleata TaxID=2714738 RepID=A0A5C6AUQ1_9BACT|nr:Ig-like domain-containing protein [Neorhodopirellula pilleata]TWU03197.1 hypothetical protein Pla100_01150 [Neorhodopirellula pilleata]